MNRPHPAIEVVSSTPRSALRRRISTVFVLFSCAALIGAPELVAQRRINQIGGGPAARDADGPQAPAAARVPGIRVRFATPDRGIEGQVRGAGTSLLFKARKSKGVLTATIVGSDGSVLYDYRELNGETMKIQAEDGSWIEVRQPPELRVKGVLYGPSTPEQLALLRSLAESREGNLMRQLGLGLYLAAPGPELVDERRGLELATQALWPHFPPGGPPSPAPPLTVDYEVNAQGYVVLTQPYDLVLAINYAGSGLPWAKHDDNRVNGCFGRCGSGCTGGFAGIDIWPSHWTDTQGATFVYQQEIHCVWGQDWLYTQFATPTTHSVDGWWTPGCQLHDNCCRTNPILCWTLCNAVAPLAPLSDPLGEVRTWSYSDYAFTTSTVPLGSSFTCPLGCIPDGGVDDTLSVTDCCSGYAQPGSTWCDNPSDWGTTWASCHQICAAAPAMCQPDCCSQFDCSCCDYVNCFCY